jgi:hypothetical protein
MKSWVLLVMLTGVIHSFCFGQDSEEPAVSGKELRRQRIDALVKQEEEGVIVFPRHWAGGFKLTSDGYGGFVEMGLAKSIRGAWLFQLEMVERKHPREQKYELDPSTPPIIYRKVNYFYPFRLGVQQQYLLGNKSNKNGISITANYGGGISLGLIRPYLVEVNKDGRRTFISYESDSSLFKGLEFYGGPSLTEGWNKLKLNPGIYCKSGLRFDYGRHNEMLNALEVGFTAELFSNSIRQMVDVDPSQYFASLYVSIVFGRRE